MRRRPGRVPDGTDFTNVYPGVTLIADVSGTDPSDFVMNLSPGGEPAIFLVTL